jgi:GntR family transcriptional regulator
MGCMSIQAPRRIADQTRRVRDLLRASIIAGEFLDGALPSEEELRAEFDAPRACVRDALTLLHEEGLLTRARGRGTFVASSRVWTSLREMHGVDQPSDDSIWHGRMSTEIIDWGDLGATPPVARLLGIPVGTTVLRIDYIALLDDVAIGGATNYVVYPDAGRLSADMLRVDFYAMLRHGGIAVGESTFLIDTAMADEHDFDLLGLSVGSPVTLLEQVIYDLDGRPVDVAFCRSCSSRTTLFSRASKIAAEPGGGQQESGVITL